MRQPAVAEGIAGRAVVEEPDDHVPELAVLEDLVGHEAPEFAGADDQHAPQADAGTPAPLEHLAHQSRATRR